MAYAAPTMTMQDFEQSAASRRAVPNLLDPALLQAARHIYRSFYEAHPDVTQRPMGVALNRYNHRGKLIFGRKPILLPQECFIPFEQIQSELY